MKAAILVLAFGLPMTPSLRPRWTGGAWRRVRQLTSRVALSVASVVALGSCSSGDGAEQDCSVSGRNRFVYQLMRDYYLWADRTPIFDPTELESPQAVLEAMAYRTVDRWSGISPALQRQQLYEEGKYLGIGVQMMGDREGKLRVAMVHADSPAGQADLRRGMIIDAINDVPIAQIDEENLWGSIWGPEEPGVEVQMLVSEQTGAQREVLLEKGWVKIATVNDTKVLERGDRTIGYLMFTSFLETSVAELRDAFAEFKQADIDELVLDLRYNGGGLLSTAAVLGSLIAGPAHAEDVLTQLTYNHRHSDRNGELRMPPEEAAVSIDRLFVLTGPGTASASELVINGLRPYMPVSIIGLRTHGKPVGSNSWTYCGEAISPITFQLVNAEGEGDYFGGMRVDCPAADDLQDALGTPEEARMAAALALIEEGRCPLVHPGLYPPDAIERLEQGAPGLFRERGLIRRPYTDDLGYF